MPKLLLVLILLVVFSHAQLPTRGPASNIVPPGLDAHLASAEACADVREASALVNHGKALLRRSLPAEAQTCFWRAIRRNAKYVCIV
jgi:hypothetical protein